MVIRRLSPPPSGRIDRISPVRWLCARHRQPRPIEDMVGTIEGTVGDEVQVRFGAVVVQVPAEMQGGNHPAGESGRLEIIAKSHHQILGNMFHVYHFADLADEFSVVCCRGKHATLQIKGYLRSDGIIPNRHGLAGK